MFQVYKQQGADEIQAAFASLMHDVHDLKHIWVNPRTQHEYYHTILCDPLEYKDLQLQSHYLNRAEVICKSSKQKVLDLYYSPDPIFDPENKQSALLENHIKLHKLDYGPVVSIQNYFLSEYETELPIFLKV